ncbi:MAG: hypothetical protein APF80_01305 [Alphaproteobacteria bacterium BRH_c36]|nr:MAG: hypothetical protein APF80_01305 [Alphaproteobacteria bacterium BRH_c36]
MNFFIINNALAPDSLKRIAEQYYSPAASDAKDTAQTGPKAMARCQLELWALTTRRTRAALAFPAQLAACRTPDSFMNAYIDFWRTAFTECADTTRRVGELLAPRAVADNPVIESQVPTGPKMVSSRPSKRSLNGVRSTQTDELRRAS